MSPFALFLSLALANPDRVVLRNGSVFEGTIVSESADAIEIRLATGGSVGFGRGAVLEIVREPKPDADAPAKDAPSVEGRESWFVVHDRLGRPIGTRRLYERREKASDRSTVQVEETWKFFEEGGDFLVFTIEKGDAEGRTIEFERREEGMGGARALLGKVRGERLALERIGPGGRSREEVPFPLGTRTPLLARSTLAARELGFGRSFTYSLFDPASGEFGKRDFACPQETREPLAGGARPLFTLVESRFGRRSETWIDPVEGEVYVEANGPDLWARRVSQEVAEAARTGGAAPRGVRVGTAGGWRLFPPNPSWEALPADEEGPALFLQRATGALLIAFPIDGLGREAVPVSALAALEARLRTAVEAYAARGEPRDTQVRGAPGREREFEGRGAEGRVLGRALAVCSEKGPFAFVLLASEPVAWRASGEFDRFVSGADPAP